MPWADIEKIILYRVRNRTRGIPAGSTPYIKIACRPGRSAPRHLAQCKTWRLDRQRLGAVIAAAAPGVRIIDTSDTVTDHV